jgi:transposase InsO family protein
VARYLRRIRRRGDPASRWLTFLQNHREVIAAFDFFTVPTVTFQLLYCFFVIEHGRRRILHFNVTRHPKAEWVVQQLREAFPEADSYRYVIFDRDSTFNDEVVAFLKATGLEPKRTSVQAPWQNGIAERWVGSCGREILDHVIALNEPHLRRLMRDYGFCCKRGASICYGDFYSVIQGNTIGVDEPQPPYGLSYTSTGRPLFATPFINSADGAIHVNPFPLTFPPLNASIRNCSIRTRWALRGRPPAGPSTALARSTSTSHFIALSNSPRRG